MPGTSYNPLDTEGEPDEPSELERFRKAAKEGTVGEELVGLVLLDTGIRNSALAHMTESWLNPHGSNFTIDIPMYQKCTLGVGEHGSGGNTTQQGMPCYACRNRPTDRDWLPDQEKLPDKGDCWVPKSESGYKGRTIPVKEDDTQRILLSYFQVHDIVATKGNIIDRVKRIADRAELLKQGGERDWPTPHDIRDTYGNRLARKGFDRFEIMSAMGHATVEQAQDYVDLSGRETEAAFDSKW